MPPALQSTPRPLWHSWSRLALLHRIGPFAGGSGRTPGVFAGVDCGLQGFAFALGYATELLRRPQPASDLPDTECALGPALVALDGVNNFGNKAEYSQRPRTGTFARNKNNEEKVGRERGAAAVG